MNLQRSKHPSSAYIYRIISRNQLVQDMLMGQYSINFSGFRQYNTPVPTEKTAATRSCIIHFLLL